MKRINLIIAISAFSLVILGLPAIASAQWGNRNDPYYGRNGGYGNGQYGNNNYYGDRRSIVRNLKNEAKQFQRQVDRELDRGRLNGTNREDRLNEMADQFKDAVNRLSESNNNRDDNNIRRVLDLAPRVRQSISRAGLSYNVQQIWNGIENNLRALSNGYGYYDNDDRYDRNNRNNRYPGTGNRYPQNYPQNRNGNRNRLPTWWPF